MDGDWNFFDVHPLWLLVLAGIVAIFTVRKVSQVWNRYWVFNANRVRDHETSRRKIWEQKQKELNPDVEDLQEVQKKLGFSENKNRDFLGTQPGPKKRFNMMFGYDNIGPTKQNCGLGG